MCTPQPTTCLMGDDCGSTHVSARAQEDHPTRERKDGLGAHSPSTPMQVGPCTSDFPGIPAQKGATRLVSAIRCPQCRKSLCGPVLGSRSAGSGQFRIVFIDECCPLCHDLMDVRAGFQQERGDPVLASLRVWQGIKEVCGGVAQ